MNPGKECQRGNDPVTTLTTRERQVFYMLLEGMKAKEIAFDASISVSGANYFIKRIYRKLNVNNKTQLVLRYFGLRRPEDREETRK